MKLDRRFGITLFSAGLTFGLAGMTFAQDAAPAAAEQPKSEAAPAEGDAAPAAAGGGQRPEGQGRRGEGRRGGDPVRILQRMQASFDDLNLSEEQKAKVQAIVDKAKPQLEAAVKEAEGKEPRERATKLREATQPVRDELMSVLDETQRQKLRERMEAARAAGGGGGRAGAPMLQALKANLYQLVLNDDQKKQLETLIADTEKQFAAIRAGGQGNANGETRAKFRELMQANRKKINEILTPEQRQKLRELMPRRGGEGNGRRPGGAGDAAPPQEPQREPL
jgi:Spy/CpxP family protein refolding chaperone